jgi:tRNA A-37 threonylcarbamoyl transferase component Bud32/tetratricopeptide (TPR) repeat protein
VLEIPTSLHEILAGRYVLKREIGRGGAATVYLAHDIRHERLVAIKVLHAELSHALGAQRFLREIRLTAGLQHPHILSIHDSGEVDGQLFYVMPYVEGDSLRQRLGGDSRLSFDEAARIGREVAGALAYAHERGIVHRDIKPENILFSGGHAVLADFGIARAINRAHEKITQQGTITGTPAYMSPEQARDRAFDGRSDVYSLACVLYEAIAGVPPFVGDTPQVLLQQRISKVPPLLREYRHDVPTSIEAVIAKALSISPDDRYDDARVFSAALSAAIGHSGETLTARATRRTLASNPWLWAAGVALLVAGGAATAPGTRNPFGILGNRVDTAQYAVVPFTYVGGRAPSDEMEPVAQGLYTSLRDWDGVKLASDVQVLDALRKEPDRTFERMKEVARSVRAGRLVWGRVLWARNDSMRIRVGVYDALSTDDGRPLREVTVEGRRDQLVQQAGGMGGLVADLLRMNSSHPLDARAEVGTRSLTAWRSYDEARRMLDAWRVTDALPVLRRAVEADPNFAPARVWLAQVLLWRGAPAKEWSPHVDAALGHRGALSRRELGLADALHSLDKGRAKESCEAFASLRGADSLDAVAWLGLAYCEGLNQRVVRDARSATGWAFEGSMNVAQHAYAQAVRIAPASFGAISFENVVKRLFVVERSRLRRGSGPDSALFFGVPDLVDDTLAMAAHPIADLHLLSMRTLAPRNDRALARNRERLLALLSTLTQYRPDDPDAFEALALVLELRDEITGTPNGGYSALSALERANLLATDTTQRARLGASDVRLHLKLGDFSRTVSLGDSVLAASPRASGSRAEALIGVAALLGREADAVRLIRTSGSSVSIGFSPEIPLIADVSAALFIRTALGVCDDSVRTLQRRLVTLLDSYVGPAQRARAREDLLERPLNFAVECLGPAATFALREPLGQMTPIFQLLGRGDSARVRIRLDSVQRARVTLRPGELPLDRTLSEAWTRAALRDTAEAVRQLDLTLTALPTLSSHIVYEPGMAASVGRSMAYRAELASRTGDRIAAALWAGRVLTLWSHADGSVAPTLARMRQLARQSP